MPFLQDANIIFGTSVDDTYGDEIAVTVVATSFDTHEPEAAAATPAAKPTAPARPNYSKWQQPPQPPPPPPPKQRRGFFSRF